MDIKIREKVRNPQPYSNPGITGNVHPLLQNARYGDTENTNISESDFQAGDTVYERVTGKGPFILVQRKQGIGMELPVYLSDGHLQKEYAEETWIAYYPRKAKRVYLAEPLITHTVPEGMWSRIGSNSFKVINAFLYFPITCWKSNAKRRLFAAIGNLFPLIFATLLLLVWGLTGYFIALLRMGNPQ